MAECDFTSERLRELLHYQPSTGIFRWKPAGSRSRAGLVAGSLTESGYLRITIARERLRAHRLAWLYVHGHWPIDQIDHRDGVRTNNKISNLRVVTNGVNNQNLKSAKSNNKCGLLGVYWHKRNKWIARITVDGKVKTLGTGFDTASEAHKVYLEAKRKMHVGCEI